MFVHVHKQINDGLNRRFSSHFPRFSPRFFRRKIKTKLLSKHINIHEFVTDSKVYAYIDQKIDTIQASCGRPNYVNRIRLVLESRQQSQICCPFPIPFHLVHLLYSTRPFANSVQNNTNYAVKYNYNKSCSTKLF